MDSLDDITKIFIKIIIAGFVVMIIKYCIQIIINSEEKEVYIKKIKNLIVAALIAISIDSINTVITYYFK